MTVKEEYSQLLQKYNDINKVVEENEEHLKQIMERLLEY